MAANALAKGNGGLMRLNRETLERDFVCPKCRGHGAITCEVQIGRPICSMIPIMKPGRYLAVTCGLCGYTEFYNMAIAIKAAQTAPAQATTRLAQKTE